ncbi:hypothetical protein [Halomicronema hongdechloris]|nr:hypothetical protein [Halomicronema hongdechloris]
MNARHLGISAGLLSLLLGTACGAPPDLPSDASAPGDSAPSPASPSTPSAIPSQPEAEADPIADFEPVVIPGERVGPITATTSRETLANLVGAEHLRDESIPVGEGFSEPATVVDLGPEYGVTLTWTDDSRTRIATARGFGSAWETPEGIGVGLSFAELKTILGSFQVYGFAWDYGGSVVLEGSDLNQYYGDLVLRLKPSQSAIDISPQAYQAVTGDSLFASDNPNLEALDLYVDEMIVYLIAP